MRHVAHKSVRSKCTNFVFRQKIDKNKAMDLELRQKLLDNKICRLCLSDKNEEFSRLEDVDAENEISFIDIIEKFKIVEVMEYLCLFTFSKYFISFSSSTLKLH